MAYKYKKRKFNKAQKDLINTAIKSDVKKEILDLMTLISKDDTPAFSHSQMSEILSGYYFKFAEEEIKVYAALNNNGIALYDSDQMQEIRNAIHQKISMEDIQKMTRLDNNGYPVFKALEMRVIRAALKANMYDCIDIITKVENDTPLFCSKEMQLIASFFNVASEKQKQQFKDCINKGLTIKQLNPLMNPLIEPKTMRILSSFYKLGCDEADVNTLVDEHLTLKDFGYNEFKDIKYILQCAQCIDGKPKNFFALNPYINEHFSMYKFKGRFKREIISMWNINDMDYNLKHIDIIEKCMDRKMPPEHIKHIIDLHDEKDLEKIKQVATRLFNNGKIEDVEFGIFSIDDNESINDIEWLDYDER